MRYEILTEVQVGFRFVERVANVVAVRKGSPSHVKIRAGSKRGCHKRRKMGRLKQIFSIKENEINFLALYGNRNYKVKNVVGFHFDTWYCQYHHMWKCLVCRRAFIDISQAWGRPGYVVGTQGNFRWYLRFEENKPLPYGLRPFIIESKSKWACGWNLDSLRLVWRTF